VSGGGHGGGGGRRHKHEEHINHEAWAIPYGDLVTLLLAFFVVMYALSSLNEGKYRVMADSLTAAFKGEPMRETPIALPSVSGNPTANMVTMVRPAAGGQSGGAKTQLQPDSASLARIGDNVARALAEHVMKEEVVIRLHEDWLEVEIQNDVLFPSGSANLTPGANDIVKRLGESLAGIQNPIFVEGHTDNVPISRVIFPSNWELSTARASAVIRILGAGGVSPTQMTAVGFGEFRPVRDNESVEGRSANRRVMLAILRPERAGQSLYASQPQAPATSGGGSVRVSAPLENIATGFRTISPDQSAPAAQPLPVGQAPAGVGRPTGPAPAAPAAPAR
jgi:chemotaxis protein MotB